MKKITKKALSFLLACSLLFSLSVPASADFDATYIDSAAVTMWEARVKNVFMVSLDILAESFGVSAEPEDVFWAMTNTVVLERVGEISITELHKLCGRYEKFFDQPMGKSFSGQLINGTGEILAVTIAAAFLGEDDLKFEVRKHPTTGLWRIYEAGTGLWLVSSAGTYAYARSSVVDEVGGNGWIGDVTASDQVAAGRVVPETLERLNAVCGTLKEDGKAAELRALGSHYKAIWCGREVYADAAGYPFVAPVVESGLAVNQNRPDATVKDQNGNIVEGLPEGNITNIDLSGMTITLPDGSMNLIDNLYYDESTKTYHIDSHDNYNTNISYHYEWTYYINYTSITYIGTTEEYNQYYEVYFELPDGRDSADLTREELEQLSVGVDVVPYGRSADDTSLRSLYHFDGDTEDASYWNYCTDFVWNQGASLTYMDASVFNGALYLDETEHDFTLKLPSNITAGDFTLQWRYYQSHTAAPQTDSYVMFDERMIMQFNGSSFLDPSGNVLAATPVGTWNELALIRSNGTVFCYLNGVSIGNWASTKSYRDTITFHFGSDQQTYKYFDELRVLNYAVVPDGANYAPTAVPHDTNLTLVLPDSVIPVADEYWDISHTPGYLSYIDFTQGAQPDNVSLITDSTELANTTFPNWEHMGGTAIQYYDGYAAITRTSTAFGSSDGYFRGGLHSFVCSYSSKECYGGFVQGQDYTMTIIYRDGTIETVPLTFPSSIPDEYYWCTASSSLGKIYVYRNSKSTPQRVYLVIYPTKDVTYELVGIEVCAGESSLTAEWVESVTPMTPDQLNTPTLAVRTDLDITGYQIGGVRPSVPEKGMVWALVENERITSMQIYNGQAWEGVDGRVWTGSRWIPASSYNVITLQDLYDIADATPDYEYIYTESGFWDWWQKSWNDFTKQLFLLLANDSSGTGTAEDSV